MSRAGSSMGFVALARSGHGGLELLRLCLEDWLKVMPVSTSVDSATVAVWTPMPKPLAASAGTDAMVARIAPAILALLEIGVVDMPGHLGIACQHLGQRASLLVDGAAGGLDDVMRLLAAMKGAMCIITASATIRPRDMPRLCAIRASSTMRPPSANLAYAKHRR